MLPHFVPPCQKLDSLNMGKPPISHLGQHTSCNQNLRMKTLVRKSAILFLSSLAVSCGPQFNDLLEQPAAPILAQTTATPTTTYQPPRPVVVVEQGYRIARGATRFQNMSITYDHEKKSMSLSGQVEYLPMVAATSGKLDLDLVGNLEDGQESIVLRAKSGANLPSGLQVAAKATCLSDNGACHSSFVDIYIAVDGVVYHHQVESHQDKQPEVAAPTSPTPPESENPEDHSDHDHEEEGGADTAAGTPGLYVGTVVEDIANILNIPADASLELTTTTPPTQSPAPAPAEPVAPTVTPPEVQYEPEFPIPARPPVTVPQDPSSLPLPLPPPPAPPVPAPSPQPSRPATPAPSPRPTPTPAPSTGPSPSPSPSTARPNPPARADQAIGPTGNGRLRNGVDLFKYQLDNAPIAFVILRPERQAHFGTNEMAYILAHMARFTKDLVPGYSLVIGDVSRQTGGRLGRHLSHTNGLDADIGYFFSDPPLQLQLSNAVPGGVVHTKWLPDPQWKLFKHTVGTGLVDRIFIHTRLKKVLCDKAIQAGELDKDKKEGLAFETLRRLVPDTVHRNHFHLRLKCSSAHPRCQPMADPVADSGCFRR